MLRVATALLATLASGCFFKPEPPLARASGDAGGQGDGDGSGTTGDAQVGPCALHDDFNLTVPDCGDWANKTVTGTASVVHGATTLKMTATSGGGTVLCAARDSMDLIGGVRVEVKEAVHEMYGSTSFEVVDAVSTTRVGLRIDGMGTGTKPVAMLRRPDNSTTNMTPFDPAEMAVWRLRREEIIFAGTTAGISSTEIVLEYSADGITWTELDRHNVGSVKFTATSVRLLATLPTTSSVAAEFDNLDGCP